MSCFILLPLSGVVGANESNEAKHSIAFYYADHLPVDELSIFERIVVEPSNVSAGELKQLQQHGSQVYAYVSIGEARREKAWFSDQAAKWEIGENEAWNSAVMDLSNKQWQAFILEHLVADLAKKSYSGIFLDTLDSFHLVAKTPQQIKQQKHGLIQIIEQLHQRFPTLKLLLNRGFDVVDDVHAVVDGVVAESLFQTWDIATATYKTVNDDEKKWLLEKLTGIQASYQLPIYVIDYVAPNKRELARQTARKIIHAGFTPWVSTPDLNSLGVSQLEIVPRKIIVLYDAKESAIPYSQAHRYLASPLEYMGYVVEYVDIRQALSTLPLRGRYAGIVAWFAAGATDAPTQSRYWLQQQMDAGIPVAFFNSFGFEPDKAFLKHLGLKTATVKIKPPVTITYKDALAHMEAEPRALSRYLLPIVAVNPAVKVHESIEDMNHVHMDTILTAPWGGVALAPYVLDERLDGHALWRLDIFKFLKQALHMKPMPVFDTTTENGSRLLMTHIDGDGIASYADMKNRPLAIQVVYDEILRKYHWPATVSLITSEIESKGLYPDRAKKMQAIARKIFALDHVEIASHTYSHPFDWARAAIDQRAHLNIPGYQYTLEKEIFNSVDFINKHLAPKNKRVKVFLWSGDALPGEKALAMVKSIGLKNMNGGNTTASHSHPSLTNVSSMMRPVGGQLQVYAPIMNENVYTNEWTGPFYGFSRVIQTFQFTDFPRRLKPIDIYYHFYSGSEYASLTALKDVYDWSLKQQVLPVWVSEYADKVEAYAHAVIAKRLDGAWVLQVAKPLKTLRLDKGLGWPDLQHSQGVAGMNALKQGRYVHLSGLDHGSYVLKFQNKRPRQAYLLRANAILKQWDVKGKTIHFRMKGHMPIQFSMSRSCKLVLGKRSFQPKKVAQSYQYHLKTKDTGHAILQCE
ncbi:MAG: endo alpha-1,4 polygalactosaminidase [Mariprofundaceae bacterium]|nr:endo alpha-1,4 polygalactosaminidase [Mariprofundaceae bacterium]